MASSPPAPLQAFWAKHPTNKGRQAIQVMVSFPSSIRTLQRRSGFSFRNSSYPRQGRLFQKQCCKAVKSLCTRTYSFQPFGHEYHTSWFGAQYITKFLYPISYTHFICHALSVCFPMNRQTLPAWYITIWTIQHLRLYVKWFFKNIYKLFILIFRSSKIPSL